MVIKYVIFEMGKESTGLYLPILFPEHVTHKQVSVEGAIAISAGFYNTSSMVAYGKSESLNLESVPDRDSKLLNRSLMGMGTTYFMKYLYEDEKSS